MDAAALRIGNDGVAPAPAHAVLAKQLRTRPGTNVVIFSNLSADHREAVSAIVSNHVFSLCFDDSNSIQGTTSEVPWWFMPRPAKAVAGSPRSPALSLRAKSKSGVARSKAFHSRGSVSGAEVTPPRPQRLVDSMTKRRVARPSLAWSMRRLANGKRSMSDSKLGGTADATKSPVRSARLSRAPHHAVWLDRVIAKGSV